MAVLTIHMITFGLIAISFALIFQVRKQMLETTKNMQLEIDKLKSKESSAGGVGSLGSSS